jgi:hypothetical protein
MPNPLEITYQPPGPVADAFFYSNAFLSGLRGPIGSGKSVACCFRIWRHLAEREPNHQGIRRARWAIVRNTYPELKTTTIKTWHEWFPREMGNWQDAGPPTHHIQTGEIDLEVMFIALDRPADVKKLLSLELTGAFINEAREVPKAIVDGLTGRVGRFPPKRDGGSGWRGVIMDTNPPDTDHWWYNLAERVPGETLDSLLKAEKDLRDAGIIAPDQALFEFYSQPGGDSPEAENLDNLNVGYYTLSSAGKDEAWIKVYVRGDYGFVTDGKPVYPEFRDNVHVRQVQFDPRLGLWVGIDFGLTPAALFGQRTMLGRWHWIDELVTTDMGAKRFGNLLRSKLDREYAGATINGIFGDPAGDDRAQTDETTPFMILRGEGVPAVAAPSNDPVLRREAVALPLSRLIDGVPGLVIDPRCDTARKGMAGGYQYKRLQIVGDARYHDKPNKNRFSHVCEAGQYMLLGAGEGKAVMRPVGAAAPRRPGRARGLD